MRMRKPASVTLSLVFLALLGGADSLRPAAVALVCQIEGPATFRPTSGSPPETLAPFQRLVPGDVLETAPGAAVTVVFFDGQRLVLLSGARATVRAEGLHAAAERVRRLASVPSVVDLAPVLREGAARSRTAAVRIRGGGDGDPRVSGLTPRPGAKVRRAAAVLSFTPVPEVAAYRLTVTETDGRTVFTEDLRISKVRVPAERLRPGTLYSWWVEPRVPPHPEMRAGSAFTTWDGKVEQNREALPAGARDP